LAAGKKQLTTVNCQLSRSSFEAQDPDKEQ